MRTLVLLFREDKLQIVPDPPKETDLWTVQMSNWLIYKFNGILDLGVVIMVNMYIGIWTVKVSWAERMDLNFDDYPSFQQIPFYA